MFGTFMCRMVSENTIVSKSETTSNRNPKVTWGDGVGRREARPGRRGTFRFGL